MDMTYSIRFIALIVGLLHLYFMILEMVFWTKPLGLKVFRQSIEKAQASRVLAMNQGLYNGFLAAGAIWAAVHPTPEIAAQIATYIMICVALAGILGGVTVSRKIFVVQAMPAIIALVLLLV